MYLRLVLLFLISLLVGCASTPDVDTTPDNSSVVQSALSLQGIPYRWGGTSPRTGFDCSGFVQYVYRKHGVRLPRTAHQMANALPRVSYDDLRSGDLVFFNTRGFKYSHVGIYLNGNRFIHAPNRRSRVHISSLGERYWRKRYVGARRPWLRS